MNPWQGTAMLMTGIVVGMVYASACGVAAKAGESGVDSGSAPPPTTSTSVAPRTVVYVSIDDGWSGGVWSREEADKCLVDLDGSRYDVNACCPEGFTPVGFSDQNGLACLED